MTEGDFDFLEEIADANDPHGNTRDIKGRGVRRGQAVGLASMRSASKSINAKIRRMQSTANTARKRQIEREISNASR
jgi:hypothetical protein